MSAAGSGRLLHGHRGTLRRSGSPGAASPRGSRSTLRWTSSSPPGSASDIRIRRAVSSRSAGSSSPGRASRTNPRNRRSATTRCATTGSSAGVTSSPGTGTSTAGTTTILTRAASATSGGSTGRRFASTSGSSRGSSSSATGSRPATGPAARSWTGSRRAGSTPGFRSTSRTARRRSCQGSSTGRTACREWTALPPRSGGLPPTGTGTTADGAELSISRTNVHVLTQEDVDAAFAQVAAGEPAILVVLRPRLRATSPIASTRFARSRPRPWRRVTRTCTGATRPRSRRHGAFSTCRAAPRLELDADRRRGVVHVRASEPLFQSIPWLAVRTADGEVTSRDGGRPAPRRDALALDAVPGLAWEEAAFGGSTDLGEAAVVRISPADGPAPYFLRRPMGEQSDPAAFDLGPLEALHELCVDRASGRAPETGLRRARRRTTSESGSSRE